ncbi:malonyl-coenzyme:anthocyanin 5-o-glucoside-6'''-o-malonyltransferase [Phtheirospermum japonicum]|uniref:Malonyl-coenzyme:anthocyanin 5-o-glucoside-6'''-o-malonyltransferase n=1 Tax=Phtheirospermum japonicum TaxID=374723 RepID=A0A830D601_9LAMI|nr:malonyl-coenzyme:anthocyanin 5-o-glucoside-6'''-o-malonyltransferase [Phtheirospermum japonicum]
MNKTIKLHHHHVSPSQEIRESSLPLTHFDIQWLNFHPLHRLLLYQFPCSTTHFTNTIVPQLKLSLSLTLNHYFPLAGNLLYPLTTGMPVLRYRPGDSVSLTIASCNSVSDFHSLSGHQNRDAGRKIAPLLAIQVTVFPETGICIGITNDHAVADAGSAAGFIKAWGLINKLGGDERFLARPFYDRSVVNDPGGLAIKRWNHVKTRADIDDESIGSFPIPTNRVRSTFVLTPEDIEKLKVFVTSRRPSLVHLSSFTIATSLAWTCYVKSESACRESISDDEPEYFAFLADARSRFNPPLPQTYFGNCLASGFIVESTHGILKGNEGFLIAVELIGELIRKKANDCEEIFRDAEDWMTNYEALSGKRVFGVAESTKVDMYGADYGWGRPKKFESVFIDRDRYSMSLIKSRDFEGGLEIGLSMPMALMDAFAGFFAAVLKL